MVTGELEWNIGGIKLNEEIRGSWKETLISPTYFTTNPTWRVLEYNSVFRGKKLSTYHIKHDIDSSLRTLHAFHMQS